MKDALRGAAKITLASSYLAKNLNQLRLAKHLNQGQLAKLAELPRSTITHLESGSSNPSLSSLLRVAAALGVSIEELLTRPRRSHELIHSADVPRQDRINGRARIFKLLPDKIKGMMIDRLELDRAVHMPGHVHLKGTKEYLTVIEGEITVHTESGETKVGVGDVLAFEGDQPHAYRNSGSGRAKAISVVIPLGGS